MLNEGHLQNTLSSYCDYYNQDRTHYCLDKEVPTGRQIQRKLSKNSKIKKLPRVGGLHNRYQWEEAA